MQQEIWGSAWWQATDSDAPTATARGSARASQQGCCLLVQPVMSVEAVLGCLSCNSSREQGRGLGLTCNAFLFAVLGHAYLCVCCTALHHFDAQQRRVIWAAWNVVHQVQAVQALADDTNHLQCSSQAAVRDTKEQEKVP